MLYLVDDARPSPARIDLVEHRARRVAQPWRARRPWPDDKQKTLAMAFAEEQPRLLKLPGNAFVTEEIVAAKVGKTPHVRFKANDYSVPHTLPRCSG